MVGHFNHPRGRPPSGQASDGAPGERVAKVLARAGVASRRDVERLIEAGRVALNGHALTTPAVKITQGDVLTVDGAVVAQAEATRLFRYHKPVGLVTTHKDPKGRRTVFDALPSGLPRLISVGRLDITSEGLLLLTNDGALARCLELPSSGWVRRYRARARGRIDQARLDALKDGLTVEGIRYGPIEASLDRPREGPAGANVWLTLTLAEGKNREVRRVLEALGLTVNRLIRVAYGPFALDSLAASAVEEVAPPAIRERLGHIIAPANLPRGERAGYVAALPLAQSRRPGRQASRAATPGREVKAKTVYKPGWAKPKRRLAGPGAASAAGNPGPSRRRKGSDSTGPAARAARKRPSPRGGA
jgi:23S rRNA pseudouridine2605 synthase